jgi:hypothetical protein
MRKKNPWTYEEISLLKTLNTPLKIQQFLDDIDYNSVIECQSPRWIMKKRKAHCFEGALFAAASMQYHGSKPLIVDMKAFNDDDHVIAVFKFKDHWGAVAKSNCTTLRFREPVYRDIRELCMSYFDLYCNIYGEKSLRSYTSPINLDHLHIPDWTVTDEDLDPLGQKLNEIRHYPLLTKSMIENLSPMSEIVLKATLLGSNPAGLYKPQKA